MRHLLITVFLVAFVCHGQDQPNLVSPSKVTTIGYWTKGEKKVYHVTITDEKVVSGVNSPANNQVKEYDFEIKVVDSTAHSYIMDLTYLSIDTDGMDVRLKNLMTSLMTTMPIRYQTDEFGAFLKIINTASLQKDFQKKFELIKKDIAANKQTEESKAFLKVVENLQLQLSKPENIDLMYLEDILAIHGLYGTEVTLNKSQDIEMEIPCLMHIVLKCTGKLSLQSVNKAKDLAVITLKSKPNPEELKKYMKTFFNVFVPKEAGEVKLDDLKIDFDDSQKLTLFLSSGWLQSMQLSRTISVSFLDQKIKKTSTSIYQLK